MISQNSRKRPIKGTSPSPFLVNHEPVFLRAKYPILDLACGYGRNSIYLATLGCDLISLDIDAKRIEHLNEDWNRMQQKKGAIKTICGDAESFKWSKLQLKFGGLIMVDFHSSSALSRVLPFLVDNAPILIKSIDNRGGNYLEMPKAGECRSILENCRVEVCEETPAGPENERRVKLRILAFIGMKG
ncbi:MAG: class I SAM-dependent methyltransferase [Cyanobacteria bacterium HKST-UBA01]|nr:class I SAM-dependent methyltransferase [Cyanobacteria bacterium HKST-UBA01]